MRNSLTILTLAVTLASTNALATIDTNSLRQQLKRFQADTKQFMNKLPRKTAPRGQQRQIFSQDAVRSKRYVEVKSQARPRKPIPSHDATATTLAGTKPWDEAARVADRVKFKTMAQIESAKLLSAALPVSPWSDDYWPLYSGSIANRYADESFPNSMDWKANSDYILDAILSNASSMEKLSPAEKYDILVGDDKRTLTRAMLAEGQAYYSREGEVESWMGICHGWAPASYMVPRPTKKIIVTAADGQSKVPFFPSDIKALNTLLWAKAWYETHTSGLRCNVKNPKEDENGRVIDPECFDNNPASWHLAVVNQIGVVKRGMVLDATYDYQVWNQPIYGYEFTYFNPETGEPARTLEEATVARAAFKSDKFKKYRGSGAQSMVGIAMSLTYGVETSPTISATDGPENDLRRTVEYLYDLELDGAGQVIGGEWYQNAHPDFLWTPAKDADPRAAADLVLSRTHPRLGWNGKTALPDPWSAAARAASSTQGMPLAHIVQALGVLSRL